MFNVGFAEMAVIAVVGLLVFGPDKLPGAVQSLMSAVRSLRGAATQASSSLRDASGIDAAEARSTMRGLADLHPRRLASSLLDDVPDAGSQRVTGTAASTTGPWDASASRSRAAGGMADLDPDTP